MENIPSLPPASPTSTNPQPEQFEVMVPVMDKTFPLPEVLHLQVGAPSLEDALEMVENFVADEENIRQALMAVHEPRPRNLITDAPLKSDDKRFVVGAWVVLCQHGGCLTKSSAALIWGESPRFNCA